MGDVDPIAAAHIARMFAYPNEFLSVFPRVELCAVHQVMGRFNCACVLVKIKLVTRGEVGRWKVGHEQSWSGRSWSHVTKLVTRKLVKSLSRPSFLGPSWSHVTKLVTAKLVTTKWVTRDLVPHTLYF